MKTKILFVITQGAWGGSQRYVFDLASELHASIDFEVKVAVGEWKGKRDLQEKLLAKGIEVRDVKRLVRRVSPVEDAEAVGELSRLYGSLNPDIVHLNSSKAGLLGSLANLLLPSATKPKIVYTVHGWPFLEPLTPLKEKMYFFLEKFSKGLKDKIITLSKKEMEIGVYDVGVSKNKITIISNGIKKQNFLDKEQAITILKEKIGEGMPRKIVGCIAGLYANKALDILVEAASKLSEDLGVVIIGEGPEENNIRQKIKILKLENKVFLTGRIEDAANLISAFDIFVLPSRKEGFPYAILEAGQAGVPVVATSVGAIPEIIANKKEGLLVEPGDSYDFSKAITFLLENPVEARAMALALKQKTADFGFDRMFEKTTDLYKSLLNN